MEFTEQDIKKRRLRRLAEVIRDHWEERSGMDTRFFDAPFIHDAWVVKGTSTKGGTYREHVVPRAVLRDECLTMYEKRASVEEVAEQLERHLGIVYITNEEADHLNFGVKLKVNMPDGWVFGESDPLARLEAAGIKLAYQPMKPTPESFAASSCCGSGAAYR